MIKEHEKKDMELESYQKMFWSSLNKKNKDK